MAKKSFKGGIGFLLKESINASEKTDSELKEQNENLSSKIVWLETKISHQSLELKKWRTGELTVEKFHETLSNHKLKYLPETNSFEKIEA